MGGGPSSYIDVNIIEYQQWLVLFIARIFNHLGL